MPALKVVVLATSGFSPFHFSVPSMVFDKAMPEPDLFNVSICAERPGIVESDGGMSIFVNSGLELLQAADIVVVPFWQHPALKPNDELLDALNKAWLKGAEVLGLCLGAYVLAYAGLLNHRKASTHWEFEIDFSKRFPEVQLDSNALYTSDERLVTSAGTAAGIDCCINIVREHYGTSIANRVARRMVIPPHREGGQAQFIEHVVPETTRDSQINNLIDFLLRNLDKPHDLNSIAEFKKMSRRTLMRHFLKATGMTLGEWLSAQRLRRSQELLETTDFSIELISS